MSIDKTVGNTVLVIFSQSARHSTSLKMINIKLLNNNANNFHLYLVDANGTY